MLIPLLQLSAPALEARIVVGINNFLEVAAENSGRLIVFRNRDSRVPLITVRYIDISPHEVHEATTQQRHLSQPCIVVVLAGYVAIGAAARFVSPDGVGNKGTERRSAQAFRRNRLLLIVTPVAVR